MYVAELIPNPIIDILLKKQRRYSLLASVSEEIFSEFDKKPKEEKKEPELDLTSEFPPIPNTDPEEPTIPPDAVDDDPPPADEPNSRKKGLIGVVAMGLLIGGAVFGAEQLGLFGEPFDDTACNFGVHSDFMGKRCVTEQEFIEINEFEQSEPDNPTPPKQTENSGGGTKDVSSASDKVEIEKTNEIIGYYIVTTDDDWYGDYVDFRKVPSKIEKSGDQKINFRCFTDDFAGTSTYFGTFRNVVENDLTVEVYIDGLEAEAQSTDKNKALILEGSCYGHDS